MEYSIDYYYNEKRIDTKMTKKKQKVHIIMRVTKKIHIKYNKKINNFRMINLKLIKQNAFS